MVLNLGLLTAMGPLSVDMYLPAFADIAEDFQTTSARVALSLSSFFIGLSVGQLIYGPLLERFGRKRPLYAGIIVYVIATAGCAFSNSMDTLIILRFFQAMGACAGLVTARAVVRDLFDTKRVAQVFSTLMMVVAVSPIIAPTLGGFITAHFGWRYVFMALAILSVLILIMTYFQLPDTKRPNPSYSLRPGKILRGFMEVLRNSQFLVFAFSGAIAYASVYAYVSGSPHLYLELFSVNEQEYGLIFAFIAMGLIGASQINSYVLRKRSGEKLMTRALVVQLVIALILVASTLLDFTGMYITTVQIFFYLFCLGFVFPNASALSMSTLGHTAGNASALMGSVQMTAGAIASALVSVFQGDTALAMVLVMLGCAFMAMLVLQLGYKKLLYQ